MNNVAFYLISDGIGGAEQVVWQTLISLKDRANFFLITNNEIYQNFKDTLPQSKILNIGNIYIHRNRRFKFFKYLLNNRFYNLRKQLIKNKTNEIIEFCKHNKISIIHSHLDYALYSSLKIKENLSDVKLVYTAHGAFAFLGDPRLKPDLTIKKTDFQKIDHTIFVSKYLQNIYAFNNVPLKNTQVIYNGLPSQNSNIHIKSDTLSSFNILYLGGNKFVKGYDHLVETIKLLKNLKTQFHVFVLGPLTTGDELSEMIRKHSLESYFTLVGFTKPPEHLKYFKQCQLLFMPSRSEALPMAAIEAVFNDLPVVGSEVGGIPEVIVHGKNGLLSSVSSKNFCDNIVKIIESYPSFNNQTKEFNASYRKNFELENIKKELLTTYTTLN